jgi:transposase-like protein
MEEKLRFVYDYEREEGTMWDLCSRFGVSRETGYVWLRRYREQGARGLVELDRAARRHPNQTSPDVERAVVELRGAHMRWGPRKLKRILERDHFLTEVLWGEPIGLLPLGGNLFHIYFANRPLAGFDAGRGTVVDINHPGWRKIKDKNLPGNQKLSGIRPV